MGHNYREGGDDFEIIKIQLALSLAGKPAEDYRAPNTAPKIRQVFTPTENKEDSTDGQVLPANR